MQVGWKHLAMSKAKLKMEEYVLMSIVNHRFVTNRKKRLSMAEGMASHETEGIITKIAEKTKEAVLADKEKKLEKGEVEVAKIALSANEASLVVAENDQRSIMRELTKVLEELNP